MSTVREFVGTAATADLASSLIAGVKDTYGVELTAVASDGVQVLLMGRSKAGNRDKVDAYIAAKKS